jgi:hypothetical protein
VRTEIEQDAATSGRVEELAPRWPRGKLTDLDEVGCADAPHQFICGDNKRGEGKVFGVDNLAAGLDDRVGFGKGGRERLLDEHHSPCAECL